MTQAYRPNFKYTVKIGGRWICITIPYKSTIRQIPSEKYSETTDIYP